MLGGSFKVSNIQTFGPNWIKYGLKWTQKSIVSGWKENIGNMTKAHAKNHDYIILVVAGQPSSY